MGEPLQVLCCADLYGEKVNLVVPFEDVPGIGDFIQKVTDYFELEGRNRVQPASAEYKPFAIGQMQVFNSQGNSDGQWEDLARPGQLTTGCQVYIFQLNTQEVPGDFPEPKQASHPDSRRILGASGAADGPPAAGPTAPDASGRNRALGASASAAAPAYAAVGVPVYPAPAGGDGGVALPAAAGAGLWGSLTEGMTFDYVTKEVLNGITIGFAQIPESVAFAFLANIKPPIALHAAWMVGMICSLGGGRPAMVNGATGAFAAIISTFIPAPKENGGNGEGVELLFPSVMVAGVLMFLFAALKLSRFIKILPSPVMIGFCNGLAIVIGLAQLHPFKDPDTHKWKSGMELFWMLVITAVSMLVMEFFGKIPLKILKIIPSSFLAIVSAIFLEFVVVRSAGSRTNCIADVSKFSSDTRFPIPFFVDHTSTDYDLGKITADGAAGKIAIQGILLAVVGTIESLMTSEVVESFVKTPSNNQKTVISMGAANMLSGFFGGMGGNAMIGLSTINSLNGGKGRLAPTTTALVVMIAIVGAYPLLNYIPVAALAGIMIVVVLHTFKWFSVPIIIAAFLPETWRERATQCTGGRINFHKKIPRMEAFVIVLVTVMSILLNIAYAVGAGVAVCCMAFAWGAGDNFEERVVESMDGETKVYTIDGPFFFVSSNQFVKKMDPVNDPNNVEVRFGYSTVMDYSAMEAMHKVSASYRAKKKKVTFRSVNPASKRLISKSAALLQEIDYAPEPMPVPEIQGFAITPEAAAEQAQAQDPDSRSPRAQEYDMEESGQSGHSPRPLRMKATE